MLQGASPDRRFLLVLAASALLGSCRRLLPAGPVTRAFEAARAGNNRAEVDAAAQVGRVIVKGASKADTRRLLKAEGFELSDLDPTNRSFVGPGGSGLAASKTVERGIITAGEYRVIVGFDANERVEYVWAKYFFHAP